MVANDTAAASEVTIADSRVLTAGRDGYHLAGKVALTIERGLLREIGRHGVYVAGSDQPVSVKDTYEQDVGELAIKVHGGGTTEIIGNHLRAVGQVAALGPGAGIEIDGNGGPAVAIIRGNVIRGGGAGATGIVLRAGTTAKVVDNTVGGVAHGIATFARDTLIERNQLRGIGATGVSLLNDRAIVRGNAIWAGVGAEGWAGAGATAGILAGNGNHNILVEGNQVGGFAYGAKGDGPDVLYLRDNLFSGNGTHVVGGVDAGGNIFGYLNSYPTEL